MWHEVIYARLHRTIQSSKAFRRAYKRLIEKVKRYKNLGVKDDIASVKGNKKWGISSVG